MRIARGKQVTTRARGPTASGLSVKQQALCDNSSGRAPWPVPCGAIRIPWERASRIARTTSTADSANTPTAGRWSTAKSHARRARSLPASAGTDTSPATVSRSFQRWGDSWCSKLLMLLLGASCVRRICVRGPRGTGRRNAQAGPATMQPHTRRDESSSHRLGDLLRRTGTARP
jgi:hypothetical protein